MKTIRTVTEFMEQDHDRLDKLFGEFRSTKRLDFAAAKRSFSEFKQGLQRHIVWEEELLFPRFEERTGTLDGGPTTVMRLEHRRIKGLLEQIHDQVASGHADTDDLESNLADILMVHHTKEETVLYPAIARCLISEDEAAELIMAMKDLPAERYQHCCGGS